jgi:mannose/fructose/N-acetylgalactosamine-specific phosphotransferase system component IIC
MILFWLSLVGCLLILDKYAFGEFGLSQPIISGTIIGLLCGNLEMGIMIGGVFQLIFMGGLPIGRDIPPDGQGAAIVAAGSYFLMVPTNDLARSLLIAVAFGLLASIIGGQLEINARRLNEKLYHRFMRKELCLNRYHFLGLLTAFGRGFCVFIPFFLIASLVRIPDFMPALDQQILIMVAISIGLANGIYLFFRWSSLAYLILGGLCGLLILVK